MQGRFRYWNLYEETQSEFLVAPILRPLGRLIWQPRARSGPRADYLVQGSSNTLVAEVKRVRKSVRAKQLERQRTKEFMERLTRGGALWEGPLLTPEEQRACEQEDKPRLHRRVHYAAKQLAASARRAGGGRARSATVVPGVLFLDIHENTELLNRHSTVCRWMDQRWARSIDLIVCFYYGSHDGISGTIAAPTYSRSGAALEAFINAHPFCENGHVHLSGWPPGGCKTEFGV
jgi:hypothetical protein